MTRRGREGGAATAELAVAVPALVLVLAVALSAVRLGVDRVRVVDAAHVAARLAARGEPVAVAERAGSAAAPVGATVRVTVAGGTVRARVEAPPPGLLQELGVRLPSVGEAWARPEEVAP